MLRLAIAGRAFTATAMTPGSTARTPLQQRNTLRAEWRANWPQEFSTRLAYAYSTRSVDYNSNAWLALVPMAT